MTEWLNWTESCTWQIHHLAVKHHYLQIPYLQLHLHTHLFATPKTILEVFFPNCLKMQSSKKKRNQCCPICLFPAQVEKTTALFSVFPSHTVFKYPANLFFFFFFNFCAFVTLLFKMALMLKCCLVFQSTERLWWTLWRKHRC